MFSIRNKWPVIALSAAILTGCAPRRPVTTKAVPSSTPPAISQRLPRLSLRSYEDVLTFLQSTDVVASSFRGSEQSPIIIISPEQHDYSAEGMVRMLEAQIIRFGKIWQHNEHALYLMEGQQWDLDASLRRDYYTTWKALGKKTTAKEAELIVKNNPFTEALDRAQMNEARPNMHGIESPKSDRIASVAMIGELVYRGIQNSLSNISSGDLPIVITNSDDPFKQEAVRRLKAEIPEAADFPAIDMSHFSRQDTVDGIQWTIDAAGIEYLADVLRRYESWHKKYALGVRDEEWVKVIEGKAAPKSIVFIPTGFRHEDIADLLKKKKISYIVLGTLAPVQ